MKLFTIVLQLDEDDHRHVRSAIESRLKMAPIPDGGGNEDGRVVAEICRGWGEMTGQLNPFQEEGD